jgi:hypothetical protein
VRAYGEKGECSGSRGASKGGEDDSISVIAEDYGACSGPGPAMPSTTSCSRQVAHYGEENDALAHGTASAAMAR